MHQYDARPLTVTLKGQRHAIGCGHIFRHDTSFTHLSATRA